MNAGELNVERCACCRAVLSPSVEPRTVQFARDYVLVCDHDCEQRMIALNAEGVWEGE